MSKRKKNWLLKSCQPCGIDPGMKRKSSAKAASARILVTAASDRVEAVRIPADRRSRAAGPDVIYFDSNKSCNISHLWLRMYGVHGAMLRGGEGVVKSNRYTGG